MTTMRGSGGGFNYVKLKAHSIYCNKCEGYPDYEYVGGCGHSFVYQCPKCKTQSHFKTGVDEDWYIVSNLMGMLRFNRPITVDEIKKLCRHYEDHFQKSIDHSLWVDSIDTKCDRCGLTMGEITNKFLINEGIDKHRSHCDGTIASLERYIQQRKNYIRSTR